jgi:hypothetical protein
LPEKSNAASCPVPTIVHTVSPSVTGEGEVLLPRPFASAPPAIFCFHATLPVLRSTAMSHCLFSGSGLITKTSPPETIGVAPLMPGRSSDHFTPSVWLHFDGRFFSGEVPLNSGPRHCCQSPAKALAAEMTTKDAMVRSFMGVGKVGVCGSVVQDKPRG